MVFKRCPGGKIHPSGICTCAQPNWFYVWEPREQAWMARHDKPNRPQGISISWSGQLSSSDFYKALIIPALVGVVIVFGLIVLAEKLGNDLKQTVSNHQYTIDR